MGAKVGFIALILLYRDLPQERRGEEPALRRCPLGQAVLLPRECLPDPLDARFD